MITRQCLDYIKDTIDIYDIVSPYVNLKKCGANWRGLSPFTPEKTPSFFVMPAKKMFKCFSSGNAGDLFRFIQLKENVSFSEAVEMIADKFGIKLEFEKNANNPGEKKFQKKDLFEINEIANTIFNKNFNANDTLGKKIREFWQITRNFSLETAKKNGIGLCKNDEQVLLKEISKKFSLEAIKECGLFYFNSDNLSTFRLRFRFRLTIPIRDIQGRIVGFSARVVPGITAVLTDAKYINSPETEIFHKGKLLFGLHEARLHIDQCKHFWLVEGQLDVLRCWSVGLITAVAPQGTAITDTQMQILKRYSSSIYCLLDSDEAGLRAAEKLLHMALNAGLEVKYYIMPPTEDPDSFFKKCIGQELQQFIEYAGISAMKFITQRYLPNPNLMSSRQKADALQNVYEIISCSDLSIIHESLLDEVAQLCNFDRRAIGQDFDNFLKRKRFNNPLSLQTAVSIAPKYVDKVNSAESLLLAICLENITLAQKISNVLELEVLSPDLSETKLLIKVLNEAHEGLWEGVSSLNDSGIFSEEEKNLAYSILADNIEPENIEDVMISVNSCLKKIYSRFYKQKINELDQKISKISLDEKEMIRNLHRDRMYLRQRASLFPQIDSI